MTENVESTTERDKHIEVLKEISTLDTGTYVMGKQTYLVKVTARDIIEAGRRLEELGIYDFGRSEHENEIKISVEHVRVDKNDPTTKPKKQPKR
jgi:hypothetical protein